MGSPAFRAISARAVSILASFGLTVVIVRVLPVEDAGSFFLVFTSLAIVATFCRFGVDNLVLKICGRADANLRRDVAYAVCIAAIVSAAGVTVVSVVLTAADFSLPNMSSGWNFLLVISAIPQAFSVIAGAILRARGSMAVGVLAELGSIPAFTMMIVIAASYFEATSLPAAVLALSVASWVTFAWSGPLAFRALGDAPTLPPAFSDFRQFGIRNVGQLAAMMGTSLLFYLLTWAPVYALSITGALASVSYFTVAMRLANFITLVPNLQVSYLAPEFARFFHQGKKTELNSLTKRSARQAGLLLLAPVLVMVLGAETIVKTLYGADYLVAAEALIVLAVGAFVVALAGQVSQLMLLCGLEKRAFWHNVGAAAIWAVVGLPVAAAGGAVAIAWVSVLVSVLYAGCGALVLQLRVGVRSYAR